MQASTCWMPGMGNHSPPSVCNAITAITYRREPTTLHHYGLRHYGRPSLLKLYMYCLATEWLRHAPAVAARCLRDVIGNIHRQALNTLQGPDFVIVGELSRNAVIDEQTKHDKYKGTHELWMSSRVQALSTPSTHGAACNRS